MSSDPTTLKLSDERARQKIRHVLDKNFLVEAAAGTGKTTSIIDRMVNLIGTGSCRIEQLAAVTFTRKAAAELRDRFHEALRQKSIELEQSSASKENDARQRVLFACDNSNLAFVGTIHSFCAALLRERPVEFGVNPSFRELSEEEELQIRDESWNENINALHGSNDPLIDQLEEYGLTTRQLRDCFDHFIEYRDIKDWPCEPSETVDVHEVQSSVRTYVDHMNSLTDLFPVDRGNDRLMSRYESITRHAKRGFDSRRSFFCLLERFDAADGVVQKNWPSKEMGKEEKLRFNEFRTSVAKPALGWWCHERYRFVVRFLRSAIDIYETQKSVSRGIDFHDLLIRTASGLKSQPQLRAYFRDRYTHLLVDEFQDTDPIQAELILYLTSQDFDERDWQQCEPRPGSLFVVGDPKQSIYRFRRGDIVTYNRVREILERTNAEIVSLRQNFRSRSELIDFNNRVYSKRFPIAADAYAPASEDMLYTRADQREGVLSGIRKLSVDTQANLHDATADEAESIAKYIRHAIDEGWTVPRSEKETDLPSQVQPSDFLIIPRSKARIDLFQDALDRHGIACEVTGGNAFAGIPELDVLLHCVQAVDDPQHSVHFLAILRDRLFGFSDQELFEFRSAGGRFQYTAPLPTGISDGLRARLTEVRDRLLKYQTWLRHFPFSTALVRISSDLGLLALAGSTAEGNMELGGFLKAIELVRQHSYQFDSVTDLVTFLQRVATTDESTGMSALPPESNVVRVMNLHKAKGLEAPIVFLADTGARYSGQPHCHIDRTTTTARGFMGITEQRGKWKKVEIATPVNWSAYQAEETKFLDAEEERLHYVATTRAANMLVVSVGKDRSSWAGLHAYLDDVAEIEVPDELAPASCVNHPNTYVCDESPIESWQSVVQPSYRIENAKTKSLKDARRPNWNASGDYGLAWGSAIHELLETAARVPNTNLRSTTRRLLQQYDLESDRIDELELTATSVINSDVWKRAENSACRYLEIPFESPTTDDFGIPVIVRGVIDLVFKDPQRGWVIVDYKSDDVSAEQLVSAAEYYRPQLEEYARHWTEVTGDPIAELGLYFTRLNAYECLSDQGTK